MQSLGKTILLQEAAESEVDTAEGLYGVMRMIQSTDRIERDIYDLKALTPDLTDKKIWVRARLQTSRSKGEQTNWFLKQELAFSKFCKNIKCSCKI